MVSLFHQRYNIIVEGTHSMTAERLRFKITHSAIPRDAKHIVDAAQRRYSKVRFVDYAGNFYPNPQPVDPSGLEERINESFDSGSGIPRILERPRTIFVFHEENENRPGLQIIAHVFQNAHGKEHYMKHPPRNFGAIAKLAMQLVSESENGEVYEKYIKPYLL